MDARQVYDGYVEQAQQTVRGFLKELPTDRLLEVSGSDEQKAAAVAFIRARR